MRAAVVRAILDAMAVRCLIVDDNASFRDEMHGLLEEQGIEVVAGAASRDEALAQIAELRPDVVLIDIDLRGESGFDLARRLRDGGIGPHVILISTHDEREYADLIEASPAVGSRENGSSGLRRSICMLACADESEATKG